MDNPVPIAQPDVNPVNRYKKLANEAVVKKLTTEYPIKRSNGPSVRKNGSDRGKLANTETVGSCIHAKGNKNSPQEYFDGATDSLHCGSEAERQGEAQTTVDGASTRSVRAPAQELKTHGGWAVASTDWFGGPSLITPTENSGELHEQRENARPSYRGETS